MSLKRRRILLWAAVILLAAVIFLFSMQPGNVSSQTSGVLLEQVLAAEWLGYDEMNQTQQLDLSSGLHTMIRKLGHLVEYGLLGFLTLLLADSYSLRRRILAAWGGSSAYAMTDELHQLLVPGRSGMISDVCLDSVGVLLGVLLALWLLSIWRRRKKDDRI